MELSTCTGTCTFSYLDESASPKLTAINTTYAYTDTVMLTGVNIQDGSGFSEIVLTNQETGKSYVIASNSSNSTTAVFVVQAYVISGMYFVQVRNSLGASNPLELEVRWEVGSGSWKYGGSLEGSIITIGPGSGYPTTLDFFKFNITLTANSLQYPVSLLSCCQSNYISLKIPPLASSATFSLTFTGPKNIKSKSYAVSTSYTPTADITTASSPLQVGTNTIQISATNAVQASITNITLVSTMDETHILVVPNGTWTTNGTGASAITQFTVLLNAGAYKVMVETSPYGYIKLSNPIVNVVFPTNVIAPSQQLSFLGGTFTIQASYLSPVSYITMQGVKGKIVSYSSSAVTYQVPPLITTLTQSTFHLQEPSLLSYDSFTPFVDMANSTSSNIKASFDDNIESFYVSSNA